MLASRFVKVSSALPTRTVPQQGKASLASAPQGWKGIPSLAENVGLRSVLPPTLARNLWSVLVADVRRSVATLCAESVLNAIGILEDASVLLSLSETQNTNAFRVS